MQVLVHLGLNKCASTFIQHALDRARPVLKIAGTWYPEQDGPPCQYGISKHYGFGPDEASIHAQSFATLVDQAATQRCDRMIVSSEYLSLCRPEAAAALWNDLKSETDSVQLVVFSREVFGWIHSLFNQYVRAVEGPGQLDNLNAFVDQILRNRAADIAARIGMWQALVPQGHLQHYRLPENQDVHAALSIFEDFAGLTVELEAPEPQNRSIDVAALHRIGQLRRELPTPERDAEIERLSTGGASPYPPPPDFLDISPDRRARIIREIVAPYAALPSISLPGDPEPAGRLLELS